MTTKRKARKLGRGELRCEVPRCRRGGVAWCRASCCSPDETFLCGKHAPPHAARELLELLHLEGGDVDEVVALFEAQDASLRGVTQLIRQGDRLPERTRALLDRVRRLREAREIPLAMMSVA